jgi:hypothetical protein
MENKSLDELLGNEPAAEVTDAPVEPVQEQPNETEAEARARDEKGRFAPKGVNEDAPPASDPAKGLEAGISAERKKRQEAETQLASLMAELEALKNPPTPPAPPPDMWEDTPGWQQHFGNQVVGQASINANLNMSEMLARDKFDDFDEVKAEFLALAERNPTLREQALSDPHPWRKAYQIAKNHRTMSELGATDVATLEAKLREQIMAEMAASAVPQGAAIPASLTNERNVGSRGGPAWSGPKPLSELLG